MVPTMRISGQTAPIPPSSLDLISLVSLSASSSPLHRSQLQRGGQWSTATSVVHSVKNSATRRDSSVRDSSSGDGIVAGDIPRQQIASSSGEERVSLRDLCSNDAIHPLSFDGAWLMVATAVGFVPPSARAMRQWWTSSRGGAWQLYSGGK
nr:hypothetical protein Itr_chr15CG14090 [Ipomoea trifida]